MRAFVTQPQRNAHRDALKHRRPGTRYAFVSVEQLIEDFIAAVDAARKKER